MKQLEQQQTLGYALATRSLALDTARVLCAGFTGHGGAPADPFRAADNIRFLPDTWGQPVALRAPSVLPAHIELHASSAPEGVVVTAICHCGGRAERLVVPRPTVGVLPLDPAEPTLAAGIGRALQRVATLWAPAHQHCSPVHKRADIGLADLFDPDLLDVGAQLLSRRVQRLVDGVESRPVLGVLTSKGAGYDVLSLPLKRRTSADSEGAGVALAPAQFGLREIARQRGRAPRAAFALFPLGEANQRAGDDGDASSSPEEAPPRAIFTFAARKCGVELEVRVPRERGEMRVVPSLIAIHGTAQPSLVTGLFAQPDRPDRLR